MTTLTLPARPPAHAKSPYNYRYISTNQSIRRKGYPISPYSCGGWIPIWKIMRGGTPHPLLIHEWHTAFHVTGRAVRVEIPAEQRFFFYPRKGSSRSGVRAMGGKYPAPPAIWVRGGHLPEKLLTGAEDTPTTPGSPDHRSCSIPLLPQRIPAGTIHQNHQDRNVGS